MKPFILILYITCAFSLFALPQYTARSGRLCDNCHRSPFKTSKQKSWENPKLSERKCNLSCQTCHVDPRGGGLRTVAGRYYSKSTLPVIWAIKRPYWDKDRNLVEKIREFIKSEDAHIKYAYNDNDEINIQLNSIQSELSPVIANHVSLKVMQFYGAGPASNYTSTDPLVYGVPWGTKSIYAFDRDRYGNLNADPLVSVGLDTRPALLYVNDEHPTFKIKNKNTFIFPMQFDPGIAIHPLEHYTLHSTFGAKRTQSSKFLEPPGFKIQKAFLMTHEWPYQSYALAGIFMPNFGTKLEDHTAFTRKYFEMDVSQGTNTEKSDNSVTGLELGMAPNYPYLNASVFTNSSADGYNNNGIGSALNFGWRDLAWGGGGSVLYKNRERIEGGNFNAVSINGYYNPFRDWKNVPVTILAELAIGNKETGDAQAKIITANFIELNYLLFNGINLKVAHHFYDDDIEFKDNELSRWGIGADITIITGFKLTSEARYFTPSYAGKNSYFEIMTFMHAYF